MLSDEENKILEQLRQANQQHEQVPASQAMPITNPDKYSFPVGLDDQGKPFPPPTKSLRQKRPTSSEDQFTWTDTKDSSSTDEPNK
jgi:hypothetical protein